MDNFMFGVLFTIMISMPLALVISTFTEKSFMGKLSALLISIVIMMLVGFILGMVSLPGDYVITLPW